MATNVTNTANRLPAPTTYTIGGVKVEFPTKAYPSQLAMMNKVRLLDITKISFIFTYALPSCSTEKSWLRLEL